MSPGLGNFLMAHLFEELQLCGILQKLPHRPRAVVGHEGFLAEGDGLLLERDGIAGVGEGQAKPSILAIPCTCYLLPPWRG